MPLSEGATRARHARRLLQRVLDFAPDGHADPPDRPHRPARGGGHRRGGRRGGGGPDHLRLGRQGARGRDGDGGAVFSPTIDEVVRESPCDIAVVKQRGAHDDPADPRPGPRRPARRARAALRRRARPALTARRSTSCTSSRPGITLAVRAQAEHALAAFVRQHLTGRGEALLREAPNVRAAILREAEHADLVVMGASRPAAGADGDAYLFGALPEAIAHARQADGHRRQDARADRPRRRSSSSPQQAETLAAADRAAEEVARGPGPRRALVRRVELPPLRVRRPAPARRAQGEAGRSRSRSCCRRSTRRRRSARSCGARCASCMERVPLLDELLVIDSDSDDGPARSPRPRARASSHHPEVLPRYGSYRGKGEALWKSLLRDDRRHRRAGPTRTSATGTRGSSTGRSGRCSTSRGSSTSRATTSARSSRAACSRKAAAAASRSSSRGR